MSYQVKQAFLLRNRPRTPLSPLGLVIHATATPGATAEDEFHYFDRADRGASAHYFVDWKSIWHTIPETEQAWHAGPTANQRYLAVELCEPAGHDPEKFNEVWKRGVWLARDICRRHGFGSDRLLSHNQVSQLYHETNHTDPIGYFRQYGRRWEVFVVEVFKEEVKEDVSLTQPQPYPVGDGRKWVIPWYDSQFPGVKEMNVIMSYPTASEPGEKNEEENRATIWLTGGGEPTPVQSVDVAPGQSVVYSRPGYTGPMEVDFDRPGGHVGLSYVYRP